MAHNQGRNSPAGLAGKAVYVRAADSAGFDANQHVVIADHRIGEV